MKPKRTKSQSAKSSAIRALERRFRVQSAVMIALVLAIAVFASLLAYALSWSYDMTASGVFTLTQGTKDVLAELTEPVRIGAVYAAGKEEAMVSALLKKYDAASDLVQVEFLDAQASPALLSAYNIGDAKTVANGTIIINSGSRYKLLKDEEMYTYGNNGNIFYGEQDITGAIRYVTTDELPIVYVLTGHGETSLNQLSEAAGILEGQAYELRQLVMLQSDIPADASVLLMPGPENDITDYEYTLLDEYLKNGGRFLLLLSPVLNSEGGELPNLQRLMEQFGLDIRNNYVLEPDEEYHLTTSQLYLIPRYGSHSIVDTLAKQEKLLVLPVARGIGSLDYDSGKITQTQLLASSASSYARYDMGSQSQEQIESDQTGPITLACSAERSSGKSGVAQSRVVVVGNSSLAEGANATIQGNGDFLLSCVNWLRGSQQSVSVPGKVINSNAMLVRGSDFTRVAIICCGVIPMVMFLGALALWYSRRNK